MEMKSKINVQAGPLASTKSNWTIMYFQSAKQLIYCILTLCIHYAYAAANMNSGYSNYAKVASGVARAFLGGWVPNPEGQKKKKERKWAKTEED